MMPTDTTIDRRALLAWYDRNRQRAAELFDLLSDEAYYARPIPLRNPVVFYEGHLPAFSFMTLVRKGLGRPGIDARLENLFARGIDPHEAAANPKARENEADLWPRREEVRQFCEEADRQVRDALLTADIFRSGHPLLDRGEAAFCILEHEATHLETLMYIWHRVPLAQKRRPQGYAPRATGKVPGQEWIEVPGGRVTLGVDRDSEAFTWDNERPAWQEDVASFAIDAHDVTNADYLAFVEAGGYDNPAWWRADDFQWLRHEAVRHPLFWEREDGQWFWRGMFDRLPLPASWPVWASHAEASAYARWRGCRLPTEAEYQRAAYGSPDGVERRYPWGGDAPAASHAVLDFQSWDPDPAGSHPDGRSAWGVHDLVGNGWEWTSTPFHPFPGFTPLPSYPEYSAEFFDGEHYVMKGGSPVTVRELVRPSFRNWFRGRYPYMYAAFRCVRSDAR
jgi:ergothioneine biosynthesis protein EgtB